MLHLLKNETAANDKISTNDITTVIKAANVQFYIQFCAHLKSVYSNSIFFILKSVKKPDMEILIGTGKYFVIMSFH